MGSQLPSRTEQKHHVQMTKLLLGYDLPGIGRLYSSDQKSLPVLATPLRRHMNSVCDFAFTGGITVEPADLAASPAKKEWLTEMNRRLKSDSFFKDVYEKAAIGGKCLVGFYPTTNRFTKQADGYWEWIVFESEFVTSGCNKGQDSYTAKQVYRDDDGQLMEIVWLFAKDKVVKYKPRSEGSVRDLVIDWVANFNYPVPPAYVWYNTPQATAEFDKGALTMALEITMQHLNIAENNMYFSNQLIESLQPQQVLRAIQSKSKVFQGGAGEGKPSTHVLDLKPVPESAQEHVQKLAENLGNHLGTPLVELNMRSDISSLAMRMSHTTAIKTADRKWEYYMEQLSEVFENLLVMAAYQGILADVQLSRHLSWQVSISRNSEPFPLTPSEKQIMATLVQQLVGLGVDPAVALSTEYYKQYTRENVTDLAATGGFASRETLLPQNNQSKDTETTKP